MRAREDRDTDDPHGCGDGLTIMDSPCVRRGHNEMSIGNIFGGKFGLVLNELSVGMILFWSIYIVCDSKLTSSFLVMF